MYKHVMTTHLSHNKTSTQAMYCIELHCALCIDGHMNTVGCLAHEAARPRVLNRPLERKTTRQPKKKCSNQQSNLEYNRERRVVYCRLVIYALTYIG